MPVSAASLAIMPAKFASMPSWLSLSHSRPRPLAGAGAFSTPVQVWPNRTIVQLPAGTSHVRCVRRRCICSVTVTILAWRSMRIVGGQFVASDAADATHFEHGLGADPVDAIVAGRWERPCTQMSR